MYPTTKAIKVSISYYLKAILHQQNLHFGDDLSAVSKHVQKSCVPFNRHVKNMGDGESSMERSLILSLQSSMFSIMMNEKQ